MQQIYTSVGSNMKLCTLQSFKRRYFYLKQQADTTYVLEFHKDDKKLEAKGAIFLDSAVSVNKVWKQRVLSLLDSAVIINKVWSTDTWL